MCRAGGLSGNANYCRYIGTAASSSCAHSSRPTLNSNADRLAVRVVDTTRPRIDRVDRLGRRLRHIYNVGVLCVYVGSLSRLTLVGRDVRLTTDHTDLSDVTRPVSRCVAIYVRRHQSPRCVVCRPTPLNSDTDINTAPESDVTTKTCIARSTTVEHYKLDPEVSKYVKYIQSGPKSGTPVLFLR